MEVPDLSCKLRPSKHAADRMISQGITGGEVRETIIKGAKRREGRKIVARHKGREVVFAKRPCRFFLVTAYWLR